MPKSDFCITRFLLLEPTKAHGRESRPLEREQGPAQPTRNYPLRQSKAGRNQIIQIKERPDFDRSVRLGVRNVNTINTLFAGALVWILGAELLDKGLDLFAIIDFLVDL